LLGDCPLGWIDFSGFLMGGSKKLPRGYKSLSLEDIGLDPCISPSPNQPFQIMENPTVCRFKRRKLSEISTINYQDIFQIHSKWHVKTSLQMKAM
jgi:hypothetical protein